MRERERERERGKQRIWLDGVLGVETGK